MKGNQIENGTLTNIQISDNKIEEDGFMITGNSVFSLIENITSKNNQVITTQSQTSLFNFFDSNIGSLRGVTHIQNQKGNRDELRNWPEINLSVEWKIIIIIRFFFKLTFLLIFSSFFYRIDRISKENSWWKSIMHNLNYGKHPGER